jgi:DNA-binding MarR family transcriptional regulator
MSTRSEPGDTRPAAPAGSPTPVELTTRLGFLLKRSQSRLTAAVEPVLARFELDWRRLAVLMLLDDRGPLPQQELGIQARVDRSTAVGLIDALEASGYVERRRRADDRRAYEIGLTGVGRTTLKRATAAYDDVERALLAPLSARDRETLKASLFALVDQPSA